MKTEDLIYKLSLNLQPVKRIFPVSITYIGWVLFSFFFIFLYVWSRSENFKFIHFPENVYEIIPIMLSAFTGAFAAIYLSVPGNKLSKYFYFMPMLFLVAWFMILIIRQFTGFYNEAEGLYKYHSCTKDFLLMNLPTAIVLLYILNNRFPFLKNWIGFWVLTASATLSIIGVAFLCPNESPSHLLAIHFLPVLVISISGLLIGEIFLRRLYSK